MGAWSPDPFGNDDAGDWALQLEASDDLSLIKETLQDVIDGGSDYLEASVAEKAVAAADTLARLRGNFSIRNPETEPVDQWVAKHPLTPPPELVATAITVIDRILAAPSEALELWQESDEFDAWKNHLEGLKARLR